jgi:hypothetical protein
MRSAAGALPYFDGALQAGHGTGSGIGISRGLTVIGISPGLTVICRGKLVGVGLTVAKYSRAVRAEIKNNTRNSVAPLERRVGGGGSSLSSSSAHRFADRGIRSGSATSTQMAAGLGGSLDNAGQRIDSAAVLLPSFGPNGGVR